MISSTWELHVWILVIAGIITFCACALAMVLCCKKRNSRLNKHEQNTSKLDVFEFKHRQDADRHSHGEKNRNPNTIDFSLGGVNLRSIAQETDGKKSS